MRSSLTAILTIVLALASVDARAQSERPIRRYSLVVGANDGGPDRVTLRYAAGDARSFASVMSSMGGVSERDTVLRGAADVSGDRRVTFAGGIHPMVWSSDTAAVTVGVRFDANVTYTLFSAGFRPFGDVNASFFGYGLGVKFPAFIPSLRLELDMTNEHILYDWEWDNEHYTSLSKLRLMLRWQPTRALALFAGPTLNVWFGDGENSIRRGPSIYHTDTDPEVPYDNHVDIWPGFVAGISLF